MMFRIEVEMYSHVLPKLDKLALEHGMEGVRHPECYYGNHEEGYLVMGDLKEQGYFMKGKGTGDT